MDFRNIAEQALNWLLELATHSPLTVSFWAAIIWLLLLIFRRAGLTMIWRFFHLTEDLSLQKQFFAKVDAPVRALFLLLASLPFLSLIPVYGLGLQKAAALAVPCLLVYVVIQALDTMVFEWYFKQHKEANIPSVFRFVVIGAIYVIFALVLLDWTVGVNVLPLLATSTVVTAILGLSLQDTLRNLFAGLTMSFEKRFRQGDWVQFRLDPTNSTVGEVTEIGWRTTKIRTPENNYAVIPNVLFTTNQLVNYSQPTTSIARTFEIPVASDADIETVCKALVKAARETKGVQKEPPPEALVSLVRIDHIVYKVKFWIEEYAQSDEITSDLAKKCFHALRKFEAVPVALPENMYVPAGKTDA